MTLPPQLPRGRDGHRVSRKGMVLMAGARPGRGEHPGRSPGAGLWTSPLHSPVLSSSNTDAGLLLLRCGVHTRGLGCQEQPDRDVRSWPRVRSGDRLLIQADVPGASRCPRRSPRAETVMVNDSELTGRLAGSKRELARLFKPRSKILTACGWKVMSSEPHRSRTPCESDTTSSLKRNPCMLITRKEEERPSASVHLANVCQARLHARQRPGRWRLNRGEQKGQVPGLKVFAGWWRILQ